jgi:hypothetical protein
MTETYLKIASFFWEENSLLNFFVKYNEGEHPFGIYPPKETGVFGFRDCPPVIFMSSGSGNYADIIYVFNNFGRSDYLSSEQTFAICATMYYYYCKQTGVVFDFDYLKGEYPLEVASSAKIFENNESISHTKIDWRLVHNFFEEYDYKKYIDFVNDFENIVNSNDYLKTLFKNTENILLAELALKNIGRSHLVIEELYEKKSNVYYDEELGELKHISLTQSEVCLNSIHQRNAFYLSAQSNCPWPPSMRLSLCTHFEYTDDDQGNYSLKFHLPASQSKVVKSNFSENFGDKDVVEVPIGQLFRYSQNYIDFIASGREKPELHLEAVVEYFTPILPKNHHVNYKNFDNLREVNRDLANYFEYGSDSTHEHRYSFMYQYLKGKSILSPRFVSYCEYLHDLAFHQPIMRNNTEESNAMKSQQGLDLLNSENIYKEDFKLYLPFWEIPRLQQIFLENYLKKQLEEILGKEFRSEQEEENWSWQDERDWINDGLDDFYNADPNWGLNID